MARHFLLVLDKYARPESWVYSEKSEMRGGIEAMSCYHVEPPVPVPRDRYVEIGASPISKRYCQASSSTPEDSGWVYEVEDASEP